MGWLKFNGKSTNEKELDGNLHANVIKGVVIQTPPIYEFPSKRYDVINIEGKNGDVVIDKNSFNNVTREYSIAAIFSSDENFIDKTREIVDWLNSSRGYSRLEDSYEPKYYRLAMFRSGGQLPNLYDKATGILVKFECKPQRFLKTGDTPLVISSSNASESNNILELTITNETNYISLPLLNVIGKVASIEVTSVVQETNTIITPDVNLPNNDLISDMSMDSELEDAYTTTEFVNHKISMTNGFPKLYPGDNKIKVVFDAAYNGEVILKPRWWVI